MFTLSHFISCTDSSALTPIPSQPNLGEALLVGSGSSFVAAGQGLVQLGLGLGEIVGLVAQGKTTAYTEQINRERQFYEQTPVGASSAGRTAAVATDIMVAFAAPMGSGARGARLMFSAAATGAALGGIRVTSDGSLSARAANAMMSGAMSVTGVYAVSRIGVVVGAARKHASQQVSLKHNFVNESELLKHFNKHSGEFKGYASNKLPGKFGQNSWQQFRNNQQKSVSITGGRSAYEEALRQDQLALALYSNIRTSMNDVQKIARNLDMPEFQVRRIKDHIFHNTHQLDHGKGIVRFDPDLEIANAWGRLEAGTHVESDLLILRHEHFESRFEGIFKTDYRTAHNAANRAGHSSGLEDLNMQEVKNGFIYRD